MIRPAIALMLLTTPALAQEPVPQGPPNADFSPAFAEQSRAPAQPATPVRTEWFARGLAFPWGIAPLPEGRWLVTEREGRLRIVGADGAVSDPIAGVPEVLALRQGGLLDVAVAPDFATSRVIYLTYAKPVQDGSVTAAARAVLSADGTRLEEVADIFVQTPPSPSPMHYGSRVVPAPDGTIFVTTGEHSSRAERVLAQDTATTYGKVVRVLPEGGAPADNPLVGRPGIDTIWSLGHRNMQGATIGPDGALWTIEHGPRGGDELNRPKPGANYGWPVISYGIEYNGGDIGEGIAVAEGMEQPVYYWDPVIAPGGMAFYSGGAFDGWEGDLLIGSLNPGGLVRLRLEDGLVVGEERLVPEAGRVRDVEVMADGTLLLLIDAPDGGILRVTPGG